MGSSDKLHGQNLMDLRISDYEPDHDNLELEEPLVVEDQQFSREAFTDRSRLTDLIQSLAERTYKSLKRDARINKRYARAMFITNKFSQPDSPDKRKRMRERFKIDLPYLNVCWNEVPQEDLELMMLNRVRDIREGYRWYKVDVRLGFFLSERVKSRAEKIDEMYHQREFDDEYEKFFSPDSIDHMTDRYMPALPSSMMMPKHPIQPHLLAKATR